MVRKICDKKVGKITYTLKQVGSNDRYVIYKWDSEIMEDSQIHRIPEEAVFDNEKDAREYLEKVVIKSYIKLA